MLHRLIVIVMLLFLAFPFIVVFADQQSTTMTWVVPSNKAHSLAYGGSCSSSAFFFPEDQATLDSDVDGNANQILPFNARTGGSACQSATVAGITITNSGNVTENIDANFAAALDTNIWLKVWESDGVGCGTAGQGGWQFRCGVTGTTSDLNRTDCKDFNTGNATTSSRITTTLTANDTNKLCFSGEFMASIAGHKAAVAQGDHNGTFRTSTDIS